MKTFFPLGYNPYLAKNNCEIVKILLLDKIIHPRELHSNTTKVLFKY